MFNWFVNKCNVKFLRTLFSKGFYILFFLKNLFENFQKIN